MPGELAHHAAAAVAADHVVGAHARRPVRRRNLQLRRDRPSRVRPVTLCEKRTSKSPAVGVFRRDRGGHLVLLVLQGERKSELVSHQVEIELGDHRVGHPVVKAVGRRNHPERDDFLRDAEIVEHLQRGRMNRRRPLVHGRRRLLLEHGDGNAAAIQRQRAHHADGACSDDDDARICLRCCHAGRVRLSLLAIHCGNDIGLDREPTFARRLRWSWPSPQACCQRARARS